MKRKEQESDVIKERLHRVIMERSPAQSSSPGLASTTTKGIDFTKTTGG
jgi:hypothetical protein